MVPAYLLSLLAHQRLALNEDFARRFPHHWLVWEPGNWAAPKLALETVRRIPSAAQIAGAGQGDALSFGLTLKAGPALIKIGRSETNDVVINDATVSRHHALLRGTPPSQWTFEVSAEANAPTKLKGVELKPRLPVVLSSGQQVVLGDVTLTYYDLQGLMARLQ